MMAPAGTTEAHYVLFRVSYARFSPQGGSCLPLYLKSVTLQTTRYRALRGILAHNTDTKEQTKVAI